MFGHSNNAVKGMKELQRMQVFGGTAKLSPSQIICILVNTPDAQKNLSPEEFEFYKALFSQYRQMTKCQTMDEAGYEAICNAMIEAFEKRIPFLLIDGENSEDLETRQQIKIRKLYADGVKYRDAVKEYKYNYENIGRYYDYDPVEQPRAKATYNYMINCAENFFADCVQKDPDCNDYGFVLGILDALYMFFANKHRTIDEIEEQAITLYAVFDFAINDYSDSEIDVLMEARKQAAVEFFQKIQGLSNAQITGKITEELIAKYNRLCPGLTKDIISPFASKMTDGIEKQYLTK